MTTNEKRIRRNHFFANVASAQRRGNSGSDLGFANDDTIEKPEHAESASAEAICTRSMNRTARLDACEVDERHDLGGEA